jgi:hypothetical protein
MISLSKKNTEWLGRLKRVFPLVKDEANRD